jgi:hypothetical protein
MSLSLLQIGDKVAIGYDASTGERGFLTKIMNGTGSASVKGMAVSNDTTDDNKFIASPSGFDIVGVVAEAGIADDAECWVWCLRRVQPFRRYKIGDERGKPEAGPKC